MDVRCRAVRECVDVSVCMLHAKLWECVCVTCHILGVCVDVYVYVTCQVHFVILLWDCVWVFLLHAKFILSSYCGSVCGCFCYMPSSFCHPTVRVCGCLCYMPSSFCHPTVEVLCRYVCLYATCQVHFRKRPAFSMGTIPILTVQFTE